MISRPVAVVIGTRPEAVKLAPVAQALADDRRFRPVIVTSGQHGDVVTDVLQLFGLEPDIALPRAASGRSVVDFHAGLLRRLDRALGSIAPDLTVVQGDTTTTLAGAQVAFWRRTPVAHVEAGLRTGDLAAPFPEESNRRLVAQLAALHLAPTATAAANLLSEGVGAKAIVVTGNTVVDALQTVAARRASYGDGLLEQLDASGRPVMVVTAHRRESWGEPLRRVSNAVGRIADRHPDLGVALVTHMNPEVAAMLAGGAAARPNVVVTGPMGYGAFVRLLARSSLVLTDSGGIQEEAPAFGVPVVVTREVTERREGVDAGLAMLVGTDPERIVAAAEAAFGDRPDAARATARNPYGDGHAARRVVDAAAWCLALGARPADHVPRLQPTLLSARTL